LPPSVELDPKTHNATVELELKALFEDVKMDVEKIVVVGDAFEKLSVESADGKQILAKVSFRGNAKSPPESQHFLRMAFTDKVRQARSRCSDPCEKCPATTGSASKVDIGKTT